MTSCETTKEKLVIQPNVPAAILQCEDRPATPTGDVTQKDIAKFIVRLDHAHKDCKNNLGAVKQVLDDFGKKTSGK